MWCDAQCFGGVVQPGWAHPRSRAAAHRQLDHDDVRIVGRLNRRGCSPREAPTPGVVKLTRCRNSRQPGWCNSPQHCCPITLGGQPLPPVLPATTAAFDSWAIDAAHAVVIRELLASGPARRLAPSVWAAVEVQLAEWARVHRPDELSDMGRRLIDGLDQDGAGPDRDFDNP